MTTALTTFSQALFALEHAAVLPGPLSGPTPGTRQMAGAFLVNLESVGFVLTRSAFERLAALPVAGQGALYATLWPEVQAQVGAHRAHRPMYAGFPKQVMELSEADLLFDQLMHYVGDWVGVRLLPQHPAAQRPRLKDAPPASVALQLLTAEEAVARWVRWTQSTVAWTPAQRDGAAAGLAWLLEQSHVPEARAALERLEVPHRENKAVLAAALLRQMVLRGERLHQGRILGVRWPIGSTTVTDALRTAVALMDGDVSLAAPTRFGALSRPVRRALLAQLEVGAASVTAEEDLFARRERFLRLGERLHPGEWASAYPACARVFQTLRNEAAPPSLMARLDGLLAQRPLVARVEAVAALFAERPGAMARQLHRILGWAASHGQRVVDAFGAHASACATPLLLSVAHHFDHQAHRQVRVVLPKGQVGKLFTTPKVPSPIDDGLGMQLVEHAEAALRQRFAALPALGRVHVEPDLDRAPVPFAMRSASKALHTLSRGTRLPLAAEDQPPAVTRLFVWWNQTHPDGSSVGRVDIDLSCLVLDDHFHTLQHCAFTDLRSAGLTHSGDLTSAPHGAAEFIDIEHAKLTAGARYVAMVLNSYTDQPYAELPECFAGWMDRVQPQSGEVFEPRTVAQKFDVTADARAVIPMVLDVVTGEVIWTDMPYRTDWGWSNAVVHQRQTLETVIQGLMHLSKPTLGRLFRLHGEARGTLVDSMAEADVVFSLLPQQVKPGVDATQAPTLAADWMGEPGQPGWAPPAADPVVTRRKPRR